MSDYSVKIYSSEIDKDIIRDYPSLKSDNINNIKKLEYPKRTTNDDIKNIKKLSKESEFNNEYIQWNSSINYTTKSKNKIKIGGKLHIKLGKKFYLEHITNYSKSSQYDQNRNIQYKYDYKNILFNEIDKIDWNKYFLETKKIKNEIDIKNSKIDKQNKIINENIEKIRIYNNKVREIIKQINNLKKWTSYILFEEKKYGIPKVFEGIHRFNDCNGLFKESHYEDCGCSSCENWYGCSSPKGTQYYKCIKCNYEYSKSITYYKNYKGK
jgi:hypothetical protein